MAHLRARNRGQIILIAAFALAVTFVALALIVNSAIFTENLASRGETAGGDDALSMRAMAEAGVGRSIEGANRRNYSSDAELTEAVQRGVRNVSRQTQFQQSASGSLVDVAYVDERSGKRIVQNSTGSFSSDSGATEYTVVGDVERVPVEGGNGTRAFRINATDINASASGSAFEVKVNATGATGNEDSWRMRVWLTGGEVHVETTRNDGGSTSTESCAVAAAGPSHRVDVTGGTVEGRPCDALRTTPDGVNHRFASGAGNNYDVTFRNADQLAGNFSMVVHDESGVTLPHVDDLLAGGGSPHYTNAIYDVTVRYRYDTPGTSYETHVRAAPGEPDE